jgi:glyoxylase-like metal-dependent hydrolase (beta-lactamase superfamily II)
MAKNIECKAVFPGVYDITERLGLHLTLLAGSKRALLFDTGYGLDDLPGAVRERTDRPLTVVNSHGHHDHACGNYLFEAVYVHPDDFDCCQRYAGRGRGAMFEHAEALGVDVRDVDRERYLAAGCGNLLPLEKMEWDLGGLTARLIHLPGHTPGSVILYVPEYRLLMPGDNWNPTTWLFFDECSPVEAYLETLRAMLALDFQYMLVPHAAGLLDRGRMERFAVGLTGEALTAGSRPEPSLGERVRSCHPTPDTTFVFDAGKLPRRLFEAFRA